MKGCFKGCSVYWNHECYKVHNIIQGAQHYTVTTAYVKKIPHSQQFQQDNDLKHTSRHAQDFFKDKGINWWKTSAESPDLNPIENVWSSMKRFLRTEHKPNKLTYYHLKTRRCVQVKPLLIYCYSMYYNIS